MAIFVHTIQSWVFICWFLKYINQYRNQTNTSVIVNHCGQESFCTCGWDSSLKSLLNLSGALIEPEKVWTQGTTTGNVASPLQEESGCSGNRPWYVTNNVASFTTATAGLSCSLLSSALSDSSCSMTGVQTALYRLGPLTTLSFSTEPCARKPWLATMLLPQWQPTLYWRQC